MTSSIRSTTNQALSYGTSPAIWIQWQGRLYGPYQNDAGAWKDGFRFDGGAPLKDPFKGE